MGHKTVPKRWTEETRWRFSRLQLFVNRDESVLLFMYVLLDVQVLYSLLSYYSEQYVSSNNAKNKLFFSSLAPMFGVRKAQNSQGPIRWQKLPSV